MPLHQHLLLFFEVLLQSPELLDGGFKPCIVVIVLLVRSKQLLLQGVQLALQHAIRAFELFLLCPEFINHFVQVVNLLFGSRVVCHRRYFLLQPVLVSYQLLNLLAHLVFLLTVLLDGLDFFSELHLKEFELFLDVRFARLVLKEFLSKFVHLFLLLINSILLQLDLLLEAGLFLGKVVVDRFKVFQVRL